VVSYGYPLITERIPSSRGTASLMRLTYRDGEGLLRKLLANCSNHGFVVSDLVVEHSDGDAPGAVTVRLELRGRGSIAELTGELDAVDGVLKVSAGDVHHAPDV
jgi:putative Mg2+ transporter-C (MgtC) family protein